MRRIARSLSLVVLLGGSLALAAEQPGPLAPGERAGPDAVIAPPPSQPPAAAATAAPAPLAAPVPLSSTGRGGLNPRTPAGRPAGGLPAAVSVAGSLALVLGLFLLVAWAMRRAAPRGSALLPSDVFEVLGRAPLAGRQQAHLLRCGRKLLLVSITPAGAETLTEVTEPAEVERLAGLCRQAQSPGAAFRQIFQQWAAPARLSPAVREAEAEAEHERGAVAAVPAARSDDPRWENDHA
jgi:flagellar biogenesis protein FliO